MTIKRRILVANVLMVGIPVAATIVAMVLCAAVLWHALSLGQGFDDSSDFREAALAATAATDRALGADGPARTKRLDQLDSLLDKLSLSLVVSKGDGSGVASPTASPVFEHGSAGRGAEDLFAAAATLGDDGLVEREGSAVLISVLDAPGGPYRLTIWGTMNTQASYTRLKALAFACAAVVFGCVLVSSVLAGRFAQRFLVRRIESQLDELKGGLRALADGDLAYRIEWAPDAEFALACDDFNLMAARQQQAVDRLRHQDAVRRQLIADISHDLRSPLTSVRGYAEALRDGVASTPEKRQRYLGVICEKADQMNELVENLFEYSKIDVDGYPVHPETLDALGTVRAMAESCRREHAGVLEVDAAEDSTAGDGVLVRADRALLGRVIENLLGNSVKYRRGDIACASVSVAERDGRCVIAVADDGVGVDAADLERIFDPFYRTDEAREHPERGSGMGLAFVRRAVEHMGGAVCARKNVPHGLVVEVELPLADVGASGAGDSPASGRASRGE